MPILITGNRRPLIPDRAFSGAGVSLYVSTTSRIKYRRPCLHVGRPLIVGRYRTQCTTRVTKADDPETSLVWSIPPELIPASGSTALLTLDLRRFKSDVENTSENYRTQTVEIDDTGSIVTGIFGTGGVISVEQRAAGTVRIRFYYHVSGNGIPPYRFRLSVLSGPTAPDDLLVSFSNGQWEYIVDLLELEDSAPYLCELVAEDITGDITTLLQTGITIQADATGPPAVSSVSVEVF